MAQNVMPLSSVLLDVCGTFTGADAPPEAFELLNAFDNTGWMISGYHLTEGEAGHVLTIDLPSLSEGEVVINVPHLPLVALVFSPTTLGDRPIFEIVEPYGDAAYLELQNLRLGLRLRTPLLRPVDGSDSVDLVYNGTLRFQKNWQVQLTRDPGLTLAPVEIGRTGIILSASGIQLDLSTERSLFGITALGIGPDFQGIYARHASFKLLPQSVFGSTPGLHVDFQDVAIGNQGVTATVRSYYELLQDGNRLDPASGLIGYLIDPAWQLGLAAVEVDLIHNELRRFFVEGLLRVPVLDTVLRCNFGLESGIGGSYSATVNVRAESPITATLGPATLTLTECEAGGTLGDDHLALQGSLSGSLRLPGFNLEVNHAALTLERTPTADSLRLALREVNFGPLGTVENAMLSVQSVTDPAPGSQQWRVQVETTLAWADLHSRLHLDELPDIFPLPPDDARVTAYLEWESAPSTRVTMRLAAELSNVDDLWRAVPASYRPRVAEANLTLVATYADSVDFQSSGTSGTLEGDLAATFALQLPDLTGLPGHELFRFDSGDANGWIRVALRAGTRLNPDTGNQEPFLGLVIANPLSIDVQLPVLPQPQAPIHIAITRVGVDVTAGDALKGTFTLEGDFKLHPVEPPPIIPFADQLTKLLAPVALSDLVGAATLTLKFQDGKAELTLDCQFDNAEISIELFDMLANLTRGVSAPDTAMDAKGEIKLDLEVGFGLTGVKLQLGSLDPAVTAPILLFEITMMMRLGDLRVEGFLRFTDAELVVGIGAMEIPLTLPSFPLTQADLDRIRAVPGDPDSLWTDSRWQAEIAAVTTRIAELADSSAPADLKELAKARGQQFLLENIYAIYSRMTGAPNRQVYQVGVELIVRVMELTTGCASLHQDSKVKLKLSGVELVIPFADPRGIAVQGSAALIGFDDDDPLKPLEEIALTLGISSDQIYFALESAGTPIPLPDFGRYYGGSVSLTRFSLGFGYTKNSLAIAFAGELKLPPRLKADADTSQTLGFGIGLPRHTRLGFRLDIIPIPGPIPAVPAFDFNLDMNSPGTPGILATEVCQPFWDGLELNIPDVIHADFKKLAFSPFFGLLPILNVTLDGDLMLGDENNGLTLVADNMVITSPIVGFFPLPVFIPMLANPTDPWVDNLCFNLRIAGFGINFNYRRPLPNFNPLSIFEILGLLADPMMPIDPNGPLANILLITLEDAYVTIPPVILRMFPDLKAVNHKPLHILINVGTLITATQEVAAFLKTIWEELEQAGNDFASLVDDFMRHRPNLAVGALLSALPPELRKFRTGGSLAGFEATAVLLLIAPKDARAEFQRRDGPAPASDASSQPLVPLDPDDPARLANHPLNISLPARRGRVHHPSDPESNLFRGIEFEAFDETDLEAIPVAHKPLGGVAIGAHVKLPSGQRFRFLGYLFEDGSFGLISALETKPLHLNVAGIPLAILLELDARLVLQGRAKRDGFYGSITARGHARWKFIPHIAELEIASGAKPASLELYSDGRFRASATGRLILFNGSAVVEEGRVDLSETHCFVEGQLHYDVAPLEIDMTCSGRVGPGPHYALASKGTLKILGHAFSSVRGLIAEDRAEFEARLNTGQWLVGGVNIPCKIDLAVRGLVNLKRRTNPEFAFEGRGTIAVFGAQIAGRAAITRKGRVLKTLAEGALSWQGRPWLEGRIEIGTQRVVIGGRTSFALDITPSNIADVDLAHLYFKCDLQGKFTLDNENGLVRFSIRGDWSIGARGAGGDQLFPLAAQEFALSQEGQLELLLIHVRNMAPFPIGDVPIKVPELKPATSPEPVRFGYIHREDLAGNPYKNMALSWEGTTFEIGNIPPVYSHNLNDGEEEGRIPFGYTLSFEDSTLSQLTGDFTVALVWYNSRLALRITHGGADRHFNL